MWRCRVCDAEVEDDTWETCWRYSSSRELEGEELTERRDAIARKQSPAMPMLCMRCGFHMVYSGTKRFHEGTRQWGFWLGDLGELFVNREAYDVYACPNCGKLEFFLDGVGEELRGEGEQPSDQM